MIFIVIKHCEIGIDSQAQERCRDPGIVIIENVLLCIFLLCIFMFFFCLLLLLVAPALPLNAAPSIVLEVDGPGFNFPRTDKKYEFIQGQRYSIKSWYREQGNLDNWSIAPHQWMYVVVSLASY